MAKSKNYRKRTGTKSYVKKKAKSKYSKMDKASKLTLRGNGLIMPDRYFVKLKYTLINLSFGGASLVSNDLFGNSLYDPEVAIGGSQPTGYQQLINFYERYKVHGSKVKVQPIVASGSSANAVVRWYLLPSASSTIPTDYANAVNQPYTRKLITGTRDGKNTGVMKQYMSTKKMFGLATLNDEDYGAVVNGNPALLWYWQTVANIYNGTGTIETGVYADIEITYYCEFYRRKNPVST